MTRDEEKRDGIKVCLPRQCKDHWTSRLFCKLPTDFFLWFFRWFDLRDEPTASSVVVWPSFCCANILSVYTLTRQGSFSRRLSFSAGTKTYNWCASGHDSFLVSTLGLAFAFCQCNFPGIDTHNGQGLDVSGRRFMGFPPDVAFLDGIPTLISGTVRIIL